MQECGWLLIAPELALCMVVYVCACNRRCIWPPSWWSRAYRANHMLRGEYIPNLLICFKWQKACSPVKGFNLCIWSHATDDKDRNYWIDQGSMTYWWLFLYLTWNTRWGLQLMSVPLSAASWATDSTSRYPAASVRNLRLYGASAIVCNGMNLDQCVDAMPG